MFSYIKELFPGESNSNLKKRVSDATGVSIERIVKGGRASLLEENHTSLIFSSPKRRRSKAVIRINKYSRLRKSGYQEYDIPFS